MRATAQHPGSGRQPGQGAPTLPAVLNDSTLHILILPGETMMFRSDPDPVIMVRPMGRRQFLFSQEPGFPAFFLDSHAAHPLFRFPVWISQAMEGRLDPLLRIYPRLEVLTPAGAHPL